jgi:general secretion pathway protein M
MSRIHFNRIAFLQMLTVLALLLPVAYGAYYMVTKHQLAQKMLTDLEPRYARHLGLAERQNDLKALAAQVNEQMALLAYPAAQDISQAGNDAQQRIRSLFVDSKLDVISIQVLPPAKGEGKFDRIPINLRVEGELEGIQNALSSLSKQTPRVTLDSMSVQTIGAVKPASIQHLGGQFNFFVLRARP